MNLGFKPVKGRKVAFCVDDIPQSAINYFNKIDEIPLTLFVSGGLQGEVSYGKKMYSLSDLKIFCQKHDSIEISCHTYSHNDITSCTNFEFINDCKKNREFLSSEFNLQGKIGFSFPKGRWNFRVLKYLSKHYKYLRTTRKFVLRFLCFRYFLPGMPCYSSQLPAVFNIVDRFSLSKNLWLILYTHDICESPSQFGMTPEECNKLIKHLNQMGFTFVTLEDLIK